MTWPAYLLERAARPPRSGLGIIPGSTPVVSFGDPVMATVATLGINPSSREFLDGTGGLLIGSERRFATLESLGVDTHDTLGPEHAAAIVDDCASYFDRRPYRRWFDPLDRILRGALGVSYDDRTACHLDLVQWATDPIWSELPSDIRAALLVEDADFLRRQLERPDLRTVLVNGRAVMARIKAQGVVDEWHEVASLTDPAASVSVAQSAGTRFVGWSCNLQSQPGATRHEAELTELVAAHHRIDPSLASASPRPDGGRSAGPSRRRRPTATRAVGAPGTEAVPTPEGLMPKGTHFASRGDLVAAFRSWLERSSSDVIGDVTVYKGQPWLLVDTPQGRIRIHADTTREGVEALVSAAPRSFGDWWVVANERTGRINKVLFDGDRTPGWYAYLDPPLDREGPIGAPPPAVPGSPPDRDGSSGDRRSASTDRNDLPPRPPDAEPAPRPPAVVPASQPHVAAGTRPAPGISMSGANIVQFPHPGDEHVPTGSRMDWNTGPHKRKFLVSRGQAIDGDGDLRTDELVFWGEWEAQSRVVHRWPRTPRLPTVLHEPYWAPPDITGERQNTDPWVFGGRFLYSNCKQYTSNQPERQPSALQRLPRGSIILFGSALGPDFVIDTVFVVADHVGPFIPVAGRGDLPVDEAFELCTLQSLAGYAPHIAASEYTLVRGATVDDPVDGMYSFVPCRSRSHAEMRFARPSVELPGAVNPASRQSPSGGTAKDRRRPEDVVTAWRDVVDQVRDAGLDLGVRFDTPPRG